MKTFREMLTLERIQGMYNKNKFAGFSDRQLCVIRDWLYVQTREIEVMVREAGRALLRDKES